MGTISAGLSEALFTKTQRKLLGLLYGHPDRSYYANEIVRYANTGIGAVQRELERLTAAGLLAVAPVGNQRHYRANSGSPIFAELRGIVVKTFGAGDVLREVLEPLAKKIELAFIYGSLAKGADTANSDIDLMVISDTLTYAEVMGALEPAIGTLGRPVNPTVYTRKQWSKRGKDGNAFVKRVRAQPKIWLIGSDDDLGA